MHEHVGTHGGTHTHEWGWLSLLQGVRRKLYNDGNCIMKMSAQWHITFIMIMTRPGIFQCPLPHWIISNWYY